MKDFARSLVGSVRVAAPMLAGLGVLLLASAARAEQFVLLDVTFTYTKADADNATPNKSHYYVKSDRLNPMTPTDWTKPVNFRSGRIHVRTEVMDKPAGSADTRWTLCYIARKGIGSGYGCSNTAAYTEKGLWPFEQGMTEWWQNEDIDWTQGIKQVDIVMKDSKGVFAHTQPDPERWFPTTLRITMIQVSEGSTYDESLVPGLPSAAGGAGGAGGTGASGTAGGAGNAGVGGNTQETAAGTSAGGMAPSSGGSGGSAPSMPTPGMPASAGASGTPGAGGTMPSNDPANTNTGCSLGAPSAPRGYLALGALGIALLAARRRRR
jgi:MYXO-CTERM domain-containing protein